MDITEIVSQVQAYTTITIMDGSLRFSQSQAMLSHEAIREELIRQLNNGLVGADVARALGIASERVSEMKARRRRVQPAEMATLAQFLGMAGTDNRAPQPWSPNELTIERVLEAALPFLLASHGSKDALREVAPEIAGVLRTLSMHPEYEDEREQFDELLRGLIGRIGSRMIGIPEQGIGTQ